MTSHNFYPYTSLKTDNKISLLYSHDKVYLVTEQTTYFWSSRVEELFKKKNST